MNAPFSHVAHGTPDALREFIHDNLGYAILSAQVGMTFAEIGDDRGLEYAVLKAVAHMRQVVGTLADLKAAKTEERA